LFNISGIKLKTNNNVMVIKERTNFLNKDFGIGVETYHPLAQILTSDATGTDMSFEVL
jgi:hypothetical protein